MALPAALKLRMRKPKVFENATREAGPGQAGPRFHDSLRVYSFLQSLRAFQNHAQEAAMVLNIVLNIVLSCSICVLSISQPKKLSHFLSGSWRVMYSSSSPVVRVSAFANVANHPSVRCWWMLVYCAHFLPRRKLQSFGI